MPQKKSPQTNKPATADKKLATDTKGKTNNLDGSSNSLRKPAIDTPSGDQDTPVKKTGWTFLTNHSHVIILLANQPDMVLREVASEIGITERAVQRIIADLEEDGFLIREKIGRQNHYRVVRDLPLRHPIEAHRLIGDLVDLILKPERK